MNPAAKTQACVALLTDFGLDDWFVGAMKGQILKHAPHAAIIDLCHAVPPQRIESALYMLEQATPSMPGGTIFCCVVDPGVGSSRRAICGRVGEWFFAGPDNGLATPLIQRSGGRFELYEIQHSPFANPEQSATFHGRDLFAPAAGCLAAGWPARDAGPAVSDPVQIGLPEPEVQAQGVRAHVLHVDHFGNLITNLSREQWADRLAAGCRIRVGPWVIEAVHATFSDVDQSQPLAYWGSGGTLEIGINQGSAGARSGLGLGDGIEIHLKQTS